MVVRDIRCALCISGKTALGEVGNGGVEVVEMVQAASVSIMAKTERSGERTSSSQEAGATSTPTMPSTTERVTTGDTSTGGGESQAFRSEEHTSELQSLRHL